MVRVRIVVCPAALIQGNHRNCTQFASSKHIDWLVRRLEGQESSKGIELTNSKVFLVLSVLFLIPSRPPVVAVSLEQDQPVPCI